MCELASALTIGSAILSTGTSIASNVIGSDAQDEAAKQNERSAREAAQVQLQQINLSHQQQAQNSARSVFMADLEARRAAAVTSVSAGESGVAGASVDMILADIERQRLQAHTDEEMNLKNVDDQLAVERKGVRAQMQSRINAVPESNPWATGLAIGGNLLGGASAVVGRLPKGTY